MLQKGMLCIKMHIHSSFMHIYLYLMYIFNFFTFSIA